MVALHVFGVWYHFKQLNASIHIGIKLSLKKVSNDVLYWYLYRYRDFFFRQRYPALVIAHYTFGFTKSHK